METRAFFLLGSGTSESDSGEMEDDLRLWDDMKGVEPNPLLMVEAIAHFYDVRIRND